MEFFPVCFEAHDGLLSDSEYPKRITEETQVNSNEGETVSSPERGGPVLRNTLAAGLRWILGSITEDYASANAPRVGLCICFAPMRSLSRFDT
jgi:hypothetical protein